MGTIADSSAPQATIAKVHEQTEASDGLDPSGIDAWPGVRFCLWNSYFTMLYFLVIMEYGITGKRMKKTKNTKNATFSFSGHVILYNL